jgi:hypothetical protein
VRAETPAALYGRDEQAYIGAFREFCHAGEIDGDEYVLLEWAVRSAGGVSDDLLSVGATGVFFARWEQWQDDLASPPIGLFPGHRENEYRRFEGLGMPPEYIDDVYVAQAIRVQLDSFSADPGLAERMDRVFNEFVLDLYENGQQMDSEQKEVIRLFFDLGIGVNLAHRRADQQDAQGILDEPYEGEMVFLQSEPDALAQLDLPADVHGCILRRDDIRGYTLHSAGALGGMNEIKFTAAGSTADIWLITKEGKLGKRQVKVPEPKLVDALRSLGFEEMVWPNGKRYRLSSLGGLGGIRRVRE